MSAVLQLGPIYNRFNNLLAVRWLTAGPPLLNFIKITIKNKHWNVVKEEAKNAYFRKVLWDFQLLAVFQCHSDVMVFLENMTSLARTRSKWHAPQLTDPLGRNGRLESLRLWWASGILWRVTAAAGSERVRAPDGVLIDFSQRCGLPLS